LAILKENILKHCPTNYGKTVLSPRTSVWGFFCPLADLTQKCHFTFNGHFESWQKNYRLFGGFWAAGQAYSKIILMN